MAKRGHSRDHRPDCKQVCIALVVTREGMPLGYEVFDGNRVDVTTVEHIVDTMEGRYGKAHRVWVMDRGMTSTDNVAWLQHTGRRYLIGANKQELKRFASELLDARDWNMVREGVEAKICQGPDGNETFVLVRSAERQRKEQAMHDRFAQRIEAGLASLGRRIEASRKPLQRSPIERQIGRLLGKNSRAAGRYIVRLLDDPSRAATLRLEWARRAEWDEWSKHSEGCYVLRTNVTDWTNEKLWKTYIQLTEAESAFRIHKTELSLRPIWHQRADRVQAHILVCFLAYVLWKTLEQWQKRAGIGNSPRMLLDEIGSIQSADIILPLASSPARELRLRCELVLRPAACMSRPIRERNALLLSVGLNAAFSELGLIQAWCNATVRSTVRPGGAHDPQAHRRHRRVHRDGPLERTERALQRQGPRLDSSLLRLSRRTNFIAMRSRSVAAASDCSLVTLNDPPKPGGETYLSRIDSSRFRSLHWRGSSSCRRCQTA